MANRKVQDKLAKLDDKIAKLEVLKQDLERREDERYLALIKQSGLYNLDVTNAEVLAGLKDLAGRFRKPATQPTGTSQPSIGAVPADLSTAGPSHGQG